MRFCRYMTKDGAKYGVVEDINGVDTITASMPGPQLMVSQYGIPDRVVLPEPEKFEKLEIPTALDAAVVLIPFPVVSKIVCVRPQLRRTRQGTRQRSADIAADISQASFRAAGCARRDSQADGLSQRVDYEGELGVVIGRTCRKLTESDNVRDYILGYTCVNDVTARDLQKTDGQWSRAKGFDTFCPVGPVINSELDPWKGVKVSTTVNGEVRQQGTTTDFIFPLDVIIRYISQVMTLLPGDLIATGTPSGIGPLEPGDMVEVTVEGIGTLRNPVVND